MLLDSSQSLSPESTNALFCIEGNEKENAIICIFADCQLVDYPQELVLKKWQSLSLLLWASRTDEVQWT